VTVASVREALSGGPRAVGTRVLGRTVYRRLEWLELRLDGPLDQIEPLVPLVSRFLEPGDAGEIAALRPDLGNAGVLARFANDDRCFGSRHDGRLVSLIWISASVARIEYLELGVALAAGTAYWYDSWTDPAMRGLQVASSCGLRSCRALAAEGFRISAAAVSPENRAGMANVCKMGFEPVATVGWVGVGPVRRPFRRAIPRSSGLVRSRTAT
jgi:hypothetical protein